MVRKLFLILGSVFIMNATVSAAAIDHSHWTAALKAYNHDGLVDYVGLKAQPKLLNDYLAKIKSITRKEYNALPDSEKIALLINAYNAYTWKAIIDHLDLKAEDKSIREIPGVWDKLTFPWLGQMITLDYLENKILRVDFNEPRIHMALVCAAISCPPLREDAYRGDILGMQLDEQTHKFLSSTDRFYIDKEDETVYLSSIFDWFGEDFIASYLPNEGFSGKRAAEKASLNFLSGYLGSEDQVFLKTRRYDVKYLNYDWSLNIVATLSSEK